MILDTNAISALLEGDTAVEALIENAATLAIPAVALGEYKRSGTPIPPNDLWIAALARQHELPVASRD